MRVWIVAAIVSLFSFAVVFFFGGNFEIALGQMLGAFMVASLTSAWRTP